MQYYIKCFDSYDRSKVLDWIPCVDILSVFKWIENNRNDYFVVYECHCILDLS